MMAVMTKPSMSGPVPSKEVSCIFTSSQARRDLASLVFGERALGRPQLAIQRAGAAMQDHDLPQHFLGVGRIFLRIERPGARPDPASSRRRVSAFLQLVCRNCARSRCPGQVVGEGRAHLRMVRGSAVDPCSASLRVSVPVNIGLRVPFAVVGQQAGYAPAEPAESTPARLVRRLGPQEERVAGERRAGAQGPPAPNEALTPRRKPPAAGARITRGPALIVSGRGV